MYVCVCMCVCVYLLVYRICIHIYIRHTPLRDCSGKNLRIRKGALDGNGGNGKWTKFIVHVDQKSLVSFQSQAEPGSWIRTMANGVTNGSGNAGQTGNGGPNTKYMVISLNPHIFRSIHNHGNLGILPNGSAKTAQQTQMGKAAQLTVTVVSHPQVTQNVQMVSNIPNVQQQNINFVNNLANNVANMAIATNQQQQQQQQQQQVMLAQQQAMLAQQQQMGMQMGQQMGGMQMQMPTMQMNAQPQMQMNTQSQMQMPTMQMNAQPQMQFSMAQPQMQTQVNTQMPPAYGQQQQNPK
jgi:hypothetical protein